MTPDGEENAIEDRQSSPLCLGRDICATSEHMVNEEKLGQPRCTKGLDHTFSTSQDIIGELIADTVLVKGMPLASGRILKQILLSCVSAVASTDEYPASVRQSLVKHITNANVSSQAIRRRCITYGNEHQNILRSLLYNAVACSISYNLTTNPAVLSHMVTYMNALLPTGEIKTLVCGISKFDENAPGSMLRSAFFSSLGADVSDELCKILSSKLVSITTNLTVSATTRPSKLCDEVACALHDLSNKRAILYMGCLMQRQNKAFTVLCEQHFSDVIEVVHKLTMKILNMPVSMRGQFRSCLAQYERSIKDPSVADESIGPEGDPSILPDTSGVEPASKRASLKIDAEAGFQPALRVYSTIRWTYLYLCILSFYENLERLTAFISQCPNTTSILSKRLTTQLINPAWIRRLAFLADLFQLCTSLRLLMEGPRIVPGHALLEMGGLRDALQTVLADLRAGVWARLPRLGARLRDGAALPDEERRPLVGALEAFVAELDTCLSAYRQCLPLLRLA
ncbi:Hypothetical protein GLP15_4100, partial [Giardia lamblia P15]